jgi:dimeric dUTPase (all-alpha-NTP-PPase superfamily)
MSDLNQMLQTQHQLQLAIGGSDPRSRTPEEQMEYVREMVLAVSSEMHEFIDETGWKTWATSNHVNTDAAFSELVDALQFWMNLVTLLGKTGDDVAAQLAKKHEINWKRVSSGYTGLEKCQSCGRALDDVATKCTLYRCAVTNERIMPVR